MKKRIGIINQRYGEEVNGGSEYYTKKLAEHLSSFYDLEIITTTSINYDTWEPYYNEGQETINGVKVRRFSVERPRNFKRFRVINGIMRILPKIGKKMLGNWWLKEQGPYCPKLVEYIKIHQNDYDIFIFVTYLYYTTVVGMLQVASKSILVPTSHDEYCIYFPLYEKIFRGVKSIAYLTEAEMSFTEKLFNNSAVPHEVVGVGIEAPMLSPDDSIYEKYHISTKYIIYVGRVDIGKGCDEMFRFFEHYKVTHPGELRLIVIGKLVMDKPTCSDIECLGFISEEDKYALMKNAQTLILPSIYESLSLVVLESMSLGIPVLVNGKCEVLKRHCEQSEAGYCYENYEQFEFVLHKILSSVDQYAKMQVSARRYVKENYSWDQTIDKYKDLIKRM